MSRIKNEPSRLSLRDSTNENSHCETGRADKWKPMSWGEDRSDYIKSLRKHSSDSLQQRDTL